MSAGSGEIADDLTDGDVSDWLSLEAGEEIVWTGEPTKLRLIGTVATGVVLIPLLVGIVILLAAPASYLGIKHTDYVVTNRSLYVKRGILSTNIESVDLDRIQNTEFTQSFWGKQLGFGTIEISTAGSSGADLSFDDVEGAREVRERINRAKAEFDGSDRGGRDGTGGGRADRTDERLDDLVAELRATREALERIDQRLAEREGDAPAVGDRATEVADRSGDVADRQTEIADRSANVADRPTDVSRPDRDSRNSDGD